MELGWPVPCFGVGVVRNFPKPYRQKVIFLSAILRGEQPLLWASADVRCGLLILRQPQTVTCDKVIPGAGD